MGNIAGADKLGVNKPAGAYQRYHEVYIDISNEGLSTFQLGSRAFYTVLHELGHSIIGNHIVGDLTSTLMQEVAPNDPLVWYPATPMTLDIDAAIALYGASTTTRTGNDTYGFNATFSDGQYRSALDFNFNTRPLITIYDNGGNDTLDASGFRNAAFNARPVYVDLQPGHRSYMLDGGKQTFAVIYTTSLIENAVGGGADDTLIGNNLNNVLTGNGGADTLIGILGNDRLFGGDGNDSLFGGDGNDNLDGGWGFDFLDGGTGMDTADYRFFSFGATINLTTGRADFPSAYSVGGEYDTLTSIENIVAGSGNDTLIGNASDNRLFGGPGRIFSTVPVASIMLDMSPQPAR